MAAWDCSSFCNPWQIGKLNGCQSCKARCNGWFPGDTNMACACKQRCTSGDQNFSRDQFLNDNGYGPQQAAQIQADNEKKQKEDDKRRAEFYKTLTDFGIIVGLIIGVILTGYFLVKINSK